MANWESLLNTAERKFGRFAIPRLIHIIVGFQVLVFILLQLNPDFVDVLWLDFNRIKTGEIWRIVTFLFVPRTLSFLWIIFVTMFMLMVADGLEQAFGTFRLNLYIFVGYLSIIGCGLLGLPASGEFLFASLILAFSVLYPNHEILLMLILPVKMKWIGLLTAGGLIVGALGSLPAAFAVLVSQTNFFCFAFPSFLQAQKHKSKVSARRQEYKDNSIEEGDAFHRCHQCGKTEKDDRKLEFRVAVDDEEYCIDCLPSRKA